MRLPARTLETAALLRVRGNPRVASVVSEAARGGALWAVLSGGLALAGGRYRRAAVDGLAGWAAGEVAAAGLKRAVARRRPVLTGRGLAPTTSSMPSSHTAGAVAYAVAAGAAAPVVVAPLVATAGTVAWSRLAARRHFPTDVGVAVVVGAVVGGVVIAVARKVRGGRNAAEQHEKRTLDYVP